MASHLLRIYKSKKSMIVFWLIILLPFFDLLQLYFVKLKWGTDYHPAIAFFLAGSTEGHIAQILLLWFLPLYFLVICTDDYIQDKKYGYNNILISKLGNKAYVRDKLIISFIVPFATLFFALTLNLVFSYILFSGGTFSLGIFEMEMTGNALWTISKQHPLLIDVVFLLIACLLTGLAGVLGASASLIFPDRRFAYAIAFFLWFTLVLWEDSLMNLFQPFTEYDFNYLIPTLIRDLIILLMIPLITYFYKVKADEL